MNRSHGGCGIELEKVEAAMRELGVDRARPFLTFSIMGLTVSPFAKFSDKGIVDTENRELVSSFV